MVLPTIAAVAVEWVVFKRFFAADLTRPRHAGARPARPDLPRFAVAVLAFTLAGFALSSVVGIEPVWFAAVGAAAITGPALARRTATPVALARDAEPGFLIFVLALGVIVQAASVNGLDSAVRAVLPTGGSLPDLLAIAALSAVFANLVNNLPATLMLIPVAAATGGAGPVLAVLIGVNVGPNLPYVGSLATLLWRRGGAGRGDRAAVVSSQGLTPLCARSFGSSRTPGRPRSTRPRNFCPATRKSRCCTSPAPNPKRSPGRRAMACSADTHPDPQRQRSCRRSPNRPLTNCSPTPKSGWGAQPTSKPDAGESSARSSQPLTASTFSSWREMATATASARAASVP
jgi:hypothetical protein